MMQIDELKERYKSLPLMARLGVAAILGLLPGLYVYFDEGEGLQYSLEEIQGREETARAEFEKARKEKDNLPKLAEQLAFTEEQMQKAKTKLPDVHRIEEILQKSGTIAKEVGVKLDSFDPKEEIPGMGEYRYWEMPITVDLEGRFSQIAAFLDRVAHLESTIFTRKLVFEREPGKVRERSAQGEEPSAYQIAKEVRQDTRVKMKFDMVTFRSMTDAEAAALDAAAEEEGGVPRPKRGAPADGAAGEGEGNPNGDGTPAGGAEGGPPADGGTEAPTAATVRSGGALRVTARQQLKPRM